MIRSHTPILVFPALLAFSLAACGEQGNAPAPEPPVLPSSAGEQVQPELMVDGVEETAAPTPVAQAIEPETAEALSAPSPELYEADGLTLRRLVVSRSIENREPVEDGASFAAEERPMYAFVDVRNDTGEDRTVEVTFEDESGRSVGHVSLDIPADVPRWRTWMRSRMVTTPGSWTAVVHTDDGELLGRVAFELEG